ncbi:disulfide bond formation protein B [Nocardiopsis sp. FIRDI 009]|uniref:disulfide bond formation protein B n=1 Tax=Nocardiopsis sp. FIRDI 009 TaxID=714197 RepID=UPI000E248F62|nr:disulfide bond formation protein B [Nocardiopsis sp. FIRDI 009]
MTTNRFGYLAAHLFVLAYCVVLLMSLGIQLLQHELPCPLCLVQRMAMLLAAGGAAYVIVRSREGEISPVDYMAGYGFAVLAAVGGMAMSARQVMLHLTDPVGYGPPVLGLHFYTWALITFLVVIVFCALSFVFAPRLMPKGVSYGAASKAVVWLLVAIAAVIVVMTFLQEGFHWVVPDDPTEYALL